MNRTEINAEYMVNSLANQITELTIKNAQKDALIAQLDEEIASLKKEIIGDMDEDDNAE